MVKRLTIIFAFLLWAFVLTPHPALAHVKWFVDFSFADQPQPLNTAITPTFIGLLIFTMVALGIAALIDYRLRKSAWYQRIIQWFEARRDLSLLVLRIGLGMTLLLAWQGDRLLTPDLPLSSPVIGWFEFVLVLLLIFPQTTPLAGIGTLLLYGIGIVEHGAFYMLDYFIFVGVAVYLIVARMGDPTIRDVRIPALYFSVGFSLIWVALEKVVYPQWGLEILADNPVLTLGFDPRFFLLGAAFVELALGYLFIIGLLERPIALLVTLVFFGTTLVFGKTEVIGHTIIHAALIVFLLEGTARTYRAPVDIHQKLGWRVAFTSVNFALLTLIFLALYALAAGQTYQATVTAFLNPYYDLWMG
jgi:hypothetical protein